MKLKFLLLGAISGAALVAALLMSPAVQGPGSTRVPQCLCPDVPAR